MVIEMNQNMFVFNLTVPLKQYEKHSIKESSFILHLLRIY